jgi:ribosome-binding protein aMBF1 (putative translation factor)
MMAPEGKRTKMDGNKRKRLEAQGWKVWSVQGLLGLSDEEAAFIEIKLTLAQRLRERRRTLNITQTDLARRLKSSQSRVAKMEAGDPTVSLDLLVRSLLALGSRPRALQKTLVL